MAVVGGVAARSNLPVIRGAAWWAYDFQIANGAWDEWLASEDWLGLGRVVFGSDHSMRADEIMAATDTDTLAYDLMKGDEHEYLTFEADLLADDHPDRTDYMTRMLQQFRSGRISQVSVGALLVNYFWKFADDGESGLERDLLTATKVMMMEHSAVTFGAQGDIASAGIIAQSLARGKVVVDDYAAHLGAGPMKVMHMVGGEPKEFNIEAAKASRDAAWAEHQAAKQSSASPSEPMTSAQARGRIRSRRTGG